MIYAFVNADEVVVQTIIGDLSEAQLARFLADQGALFGATSFVIVDDDRAVWIGGSYDAGSGAFSPPPIAEPELVIEEIVNVDATVE